MKGSVYVSKATEHWDIKALNELCTKASIYNTAHGITGYLYYEETYFFQYIEGAESQIDTLYTKIQKDERHEILNTHSQSSMKRRRFPTWQMPRIKESQLIAIGLDKVLLDFLIMFDGKIYPHTEKRENILWSMIDRLSELQ
ncbi:MAG: BLUF domain-containing protein [Bacteroidia bacterium]